jgi:hypothetical protein
MQVFCKGTSGYAETECCVCGKGIVIFWERQSRRERAETLREIQKTLRSHHYNTAGPQAHPQSGFLVPEKEIHFPFSRAAVQGHAPTWAL